MNEETKEFFRGVAYIVIGLHFLDSDPNFDTDWVSLWSIWLFILGLFMFVVGAKKVL